MELPRRTFLHMAVSAAALPALPRIARAQAYPTRPVRVIVPFAPAGTTDILARLMGQWLSEHLGQQFVIENRPGASTTIGTEVVVRAPADGYTLLLATPSSAINTTLFEGKLNYNFLRDIVPIAGIFRVPNVMVVHPSVPAKTVPEFIAYAKANPTGRSRSRRSNNWAQVRSELQNETTWRAGAGLARAYGTCCP
jgi:tripartite-type tricarboxylate transporter receptor subunit TctC